MTAGPLTAKGIILDSWPIARLGMRRVLETAGIECALETADTEEALMGLKTHHARLLIVGGQAPDGPFVIAQAKASDDPPAVAVLVGRSTPKEARQLLDAGADGLLTRSADPYDVVSGLRCLLAGERVISPVLVPLLVGMTGSDPEPVPSANAPGGLNLTPKERQVLLKLAEGLSHEEIAEAMFVSFHTVKTHVSHIYAKLGVATRNGAVARGIALGLIS